MPGGDRTGPVGAGRMTGRAAGYCAGYGAPGFVNPMPGYGGGRRRGGAFGPGFFRGRGFGRGRGYSWWGPGVRPWAPPTPEQEVDDLRDEASHLESALQEIRTRLEELESGGAGE